MASEWEKRGVDWCLPPGLSSPCVLLTLTTHVLSVQMCMLVYADGRLDSNPIRVSTPFLIQLACRERTLRDCIAIYMSPPPLDNSTWCKYKQFKPEATTAFNMFFHPALDPTAGKVPTLDRPRAADSYAWTQKKLEFHAPFTRSHRHSCPGRRTM